MAGDVTTVKTPKRTNPPTRRDRADATRLRIVKAAYELFCERGYAGTMLSDIAAASGVAVQTVRFNFHTKGELLSRAYDFAVLGEGEPVPPQKQPWWTAAAAAPDVTSALRDLVPGIGAILARATPLDTVVRGSVTGDPETARVRALHERWRAEGYREMLDVLLPEGTAPPRPDARGGDAPSAALPGHGRLPGARPRPGMDPRVMARLGRSDDIAGTLRDADRVARVKGS